MQQTRDGVVTQAESLLVANAVRLDDDLPPELMAPLACGVQTGMASVMIALAATASDSIAIFGCGTVGLAAVMAARSGSRCRGPSTKGGRTGLMVGVSEMRE